ncbi:MAG: VTT domain-containing protein [Candidatus Omnitrophica bacterium]|nr:VTT domain-containing protein [Candidatus Omnitrophota bacterium]
MSRPFKRFLAFIGIFAVLILLGKFFSFDTAKMNEFFKRIPIIYSCLAFIALYIIANFFIFWDIKDVLKIIGAVIFGAFLSTGLIFVAEIINALVFFNISNILGKEFLEKSLQGKFKGLYEKLGNLSFTWIVLLRLVPLIPYRILDVSFGLSGVRLKKYMLAVILASPPRIFFIQFPLAAVGEFSVGKIAAYFQSHPLILWSLFCYCIISFFFAVGLRRRLR